ncbi:uncharacterized protein V6R79_001107, partial [Siganus canaliculatus]
MSTMQPLSKAAETWSQTTVLWLDSRTHLYRNLQGLLDLYLRHMDSETCSDKQHRPAALGPWRQTGTRSSSLLTVHADLLVLWGH